MGKDIKKIYAENFSKMLKIPTVTNCDKALFDELQNVMWDIAPEFAKLPRTSPRNSSLVIKWKGKNSDRPLVLMGHQDVVPAEDVTKWKHAPYDGAIADDYVWGRGALDCKSTVFASMTAAEELIKEGFVPEQDIYFAYGDDEETSGGSAIAEAKYLTSIGVKPALVIDEGGGMIKKDGQLEKFLTKNVGVIGVCEKGFADFKFIARSKGGHSSAPPKNTPFIRLSRFMLKIERKNIFDVQVLPIVKEMLAGFSKAVKPAFKPIVKYAYLFAPLAAKVLPEQLACELKAFMSTTMVFTMAEGSHASNNIPDAAWVLANLRFSPQEGHKASIAKLEKIAKKYDIEIEVLNTRDASVVADTKSAEYKFTEEMINKTYGETALSPYLIAGGTDCRYMQDICPTALRFTPFLVSVDEMSACHAANERVSIESLAGGVSFFRNVITNYR